MHINDDFAYFGSLLDAQRGGSLNKRIKVTATPTVTPAVAGTSHARPAILTGAMPEGFDPDQPFKHLGVTISPLPLIVGKITHSNGTDAKPEPTITTRQVGGTHYEKLGIDPFTYALANKLDPLQFSVVKYVTRFRDKAGIQDLNKAIDCLQRLVKHEMSQGRK
jgi:hypothetical protein